MTGPCLPSAAGHILDGCHRFEVRIYFEDTDLSGLVYHANYLRYMERARSDMLDCLGIDQRRAMEAGEGVYAVAELAIRYAAPARLGDLLSVETRCIEVGGASVMMRQRIFRAGQMLTDATVRAGFLTPAGRPRRQPTDWVARYRALLPESAA
ncbi:MAG: YbgC/FadM family acyl-CoA thioesterase [Thermaurantiacus sp.]